MSDTRQQILQAVLEAVDDVNEQLPPDRRIPREATAPLAGVNGNLDSLGLVNLVLGTEQKVADRLGMPIVLTGDAELFEPDGPCATVQRLTDHIVRMVERVSHA
jgi:hypothetical protein